MQYCYFVALIHCFMRGVPVSRLEGGMRLQGTGMPWTVSHCRCFRDHEPKLSSHSECCAHEHSFHSCSVRCRAGSTRLCLFVVLCESSPAGKAVRLGATAGASHFSLPRFVDVRSW